MKSKIASLILTSELKTFIENDFANLAHTPPASPCLCAALGFSPPCPLHYNPRLRAPSMALSPIHGVSLSVITALAHISFCLSLLLSVWAQKGPSWPGELSVLQEQLLPCTGLITRELMGLLHPHLCFHLMGIFVEERVGQFSFCLAISGL